MFKIMKKSRSNFYEIEYHNEIVCLFVFFSITICKQNTFHLEK